MSSQQTSKNQEFLPEKHPPQIFEDDANTGLLHGIKREPERDREMGIAKEKIIFALIFAFLIPIVSWVSATAGDFSHSVREYLVR